MHGTARNRGAVGRRDRGDTLDIDFANTFSTVTAYLFFMAFPVKLAVGTTLLLLPFARRLWFGPPSPRRPGTPAG